MRWPLVFILLSFIVAATIASDDKIDNEIDVDEDELLYKKSEDQEQVEEEITGDNDDVDLKSNDGNINYEGHNFDDDQEDDERDAVIVEAEWKAAETNDDFREIKLEEAYERAVQSYLDDNYEKCIVEFNLVIQRYKEYKNAVINCRKKCRDSVSYFTPIFFENIEDLHFYEKKVRETLCLLRCNQDYRDVAGSQALKRLPASIEQKIIDLKPYEYLHICYYQRSRYQEAANAVFTYLAQHADHKMSIDNLRYYLSLPEVKETEVSNLEAAEFIKFYVEGVKAYEEEYFEEAIENLEKSLRFYLKAEEDCRFYCEGPFDQGWHPEFTSSFANHFTYCLKCKRGCSRFLNRINGDYQKDLLASHYNYLQFAYYKTGNIKKTCQAVESYLLFFPADETMNYNKEYYKNLPKVQEEYFEPRPEAFEYVKRQEYELRILSFISQEFSAIDIKLNEKKKDKKQEEEKLMDHPPPGHSPAVQAIINNQSLLYEREETARRESQILDSLENVRVVFNEKELNGTFRYLADGFVTKLQCNLLIKLAQMAAVVGDGYENNKSPHSKYELFEGLTVGRAALMVYFGLLTPDYLELFLKSSEKARSHVERYFNLHQHLYFTYTHLVCRSALPGSPVNQQVFSHDIHADNCLAIKEGVCLHESPAYTWRDYSAIVYLNDDFEGGEFIFAADPKAMNIQSVVDPYCGRMVAFSGDEKNLHGVKGVHRGQRCALALWFTLDKRYDELERKLAWIILDRVKLKGPVSDGVQNMSIPLNYDNLLSKRFKEDDLLKLLLQISRH
ncbi:GSCOCG00002996001-RA-CDS [Cotesia congregata]|nr:GSCOCG00002996001-RA-CDS [Cotesia congregata]